MASGVETAVGASSPRTSGDAARPGLLARRRRWFAAVAFIALARAARRRARRARQSRRRSRPRGGGWRPTPAAPKRWADWLALPAAIDAFLKDHFGLRHAMIQTHHDLTKPMLGFGGTEVLIGRDGRMFYLGDDLVRQSAGLVVRDERVAETVAMLVKMRDELQKRGIRFLVASPPNSATVYNDDLPAWAQNKGRRTEYDLLLAELAERGIKTVDLRPPLAAGARRSRRPISSTIRTGRRRARSRRSTRSSRPTAIRTGRSIRRPRSAPVTLRTALDVARVAGVEKGLSEPNQELALSGGTREAELSPRPMPDHVQVSGQARSDGHGDRRFLHHRPFHDDAGAACRRGRSGSITSGAASTGSGSTSIIRTRSGGCRPSAS